MIFGDFIHALHEAGWQAIHDAQYEGISRVWRDLFPVVAKLQDEIDCLKWELDNERSPTNDRT